MVHPVNFVLLFGGLFRFSLAASRTSPPAGAVVVRSGTTAAGEFATISAAVSSLPNDKTSQSIFIFPGTYTEQVDITRTGPLTIYGYTNDTSSYGGNQATLQAGVPASTAGSDDASGTLRIHTDNFSMYNVNVKNTFGIGSQAIAISQYGNRVGLYACGFYGYQDTLYANKGAQVYLKGYIEGAVDFIFGRTGLAYFGGNTIAVKAPGCITASGREANDTGSYVFNQNTIVLATGSSVSSTSGKVFLGRPWGDFAKVVFKNTIVTTPLNTALWSIWNTGDPRTHEVFLADFNTTGSGVTGVSRANFSTLLSATQAASYSIASAVGSDYTTWVDTAYLV
ncbi:carbohydrate esterase family 8 protein [Hypholoma sublateritium FD-334 SS-4]|uniref:Pectinesterase n=1 Tax=Hypholoma sublateritium (strain FD-334 SS-4) TaxID=945553 RepID=A0A0D2Q5T9_HYPSF|nr:carbohydrate esterase family 8 protein [Hypholoma sublateritium FD-334 SS-4]